MEKRLGVVAIILENRDYAEQVNDILHVYHPLIVGRMGIPYKERGVAVISLIVDATGDEVSALTGKLGRIEGVTVKSALAKGNAP
ncbi:MAG: TM1266 family iron-only hydrogenase system putative regulator [Oscillospiraceae bacterium]